MNIEIQQQFRSYLDIFYISIYRIRLLIEMSKKIGDCSNQIKCQDLWGFLQNNLIVGSVVVEVFSLFDKKNNSLIKKFAKLLKLHRRDYVASTDILTWIKSIEKYDNYRHKILVHKEVNPSNVQEIMYIEFLKIIDELDKKLLELESNELAEINAKNTTRIVSSLSSNSHVISQLKQMLNIDCSLEFDLC